MMITMMRFCCSVLFALLLSACAVSNISADYKLADAKVSGVVSGSITSGTGLGSYQLYLQSLSTGEIHRVEFGGVMWTPMTVINAEHKPHPGLKVRGAPFAIELPAGRYLLQRWRMSKGNWHFASTEETGVVFEVEAGRAIYLGNFHFMGGDVRPFRQARPSYVSLSDQAERDLPVIKAEFKALAAVPLSAVLTPGTKIERLAGAGDVTLTMPIYIPVVR